MVDEAGSQPIDSGGVTCLTSLRGAPWGPLRPVVNPDERSVSSLREKVRLDQGLQQSFAKLPIEAPEPLRLGGRQAKSGHLDKFTLNSLKDVLDAHGYTGEEQPTCRVGFVASGGLEVPIND